MTRRLLRVVLAEFSAEGSAIALGRLLRDDGVEVVYAGRLETTEQLVRTVEQEDPDILGVVRGAADEPDDLGEAIPGVLHFAVGDRPSRLENVFETAEEAAKWVSGVRSHTLEVPSDRVR